MNFSWSQKLDTTNEVVRGVGGSNYQAIMVRIVVRDETQLNSMETQLSESGEQSNSSLMHKEAKS